MSEHQLKREYAGKAEMGSITPTCSCGWRGTAESAYNDYQHYNLRRQESKHIQENLRAEKESKK